VAPAVGDALLVALRDANAEAVLLLEPLGNGEADTVALLEGVPAAECVPELLTQGDDVGVPLPLPLVAAVLLAVPVLLRDEDAVALPSAVANIGSSAWAAATASARSSR
jgi:hypothetical protein